MWYLLLCFVNYNSKHCHQWRTGSVRYTSQGLGRLDTQVKDWVSEIHKSRTGSLTYTSQGLGQWDTQVKDWVSEIHKSRTGSLRYTSQGLGHWDTQVKDWVTEIHKSRTGSVRYTSQGLGQWDTQVKDWVTDIHKSRTGSLTYTSQGLGQWDTQVKDWSMKGVFYLEGMRCCFSTSITKLTNMNESSIYMTGWYRIGIVILTRLVLSYWLDWYFHINSKARHLLVFCTHWYRQFYN